MKGNTKIPKKGAMLLSSERNEFILRLLAEQGAARTTQLAKSMNVTDETVRNDLIRLEQSGLLVRVHGGAVSLNKKTSNENLLKHTTYDVELAKAVTRHIQPHTTIFLDGGALGNLIASYLPAEEMTVVSNSTTVIERLKANSSIEAYCTGGLLDRKSGLFIGHRAADSLGHMGMDTIILIADSYSPTRGPGFISQAKAEFFERILPYAKFLCVVCPSSAMQGHSSYYTIPLSKVSLLITDEGAEEEEITVIEQTGVAVEQA